MSDTTISDAALPVVARYVGTTSNIYRYIAEDLAVVDAQIADEAKKPEAVRLRDALRERAEFEAWAEKRGHDLSVTRDHPIFIDGVYKNGDTSTAWTTWQAALAATGKQQVGEVQASDFDDAELQFYREEVGNLDGLLCMLGVMEITHDGDYTAAWKNTIEAVDRLAARQQDQT